MNKSVLMAAGLFLLGSASGAMAQGCRQGMEGGQSCVSGERMECVKEFDYRTQEFKYHLAPINSAGLVFSPDTPFYRMTTGYTPASCHDSDANTVKRASGLHAG